MSHATSASSPTSNAGATRFSGSARITPKSSIVRSALYPLALLGLGFRPRHDLAHLLSLRLEQSLQKAVRRKDSRQGPHLLADADHSSHKAHQ
jgi:hypothetical protein